MKSKLVMLITVAALAFTATSAMAAGKASSARGKVSVSGSGAARSAMTKKAGKTALPQPHTILPGATNNF